MWVENDHARGPTTGPRTGGQGQLAAGRGKCEGHVHRCAQKFNSRRNLSGEGNLRTHQPDRSRQSACNTPFLTPILPADAGSKIRPWPDEHGQCSDTPTWRGTWTNYGTRSTMLSIPHRLQKTLKYRIARGPDRTDDRMSGNQRPGCLPGTARRGSDP